LKGDKEKPALIHLGGIASCSDGGSTIAGAAGQAVKSKILSRAIVSIALIYFNAAYIDPVVSYAIATAYSILGRITDRKMESGILRHT